MKTTLQNFFKSKKNKIFAGAVFAVVLIAGGGIYASNRANQVKQLAKQEQKSAEEQAKKEQEEKAKVKQQKAEVDKKEKDNFVENKSNSVKKETQKNNNSTSKKAETSKKNKKKDNNNNNNNSNKDNTFEVEGDGYPTVLGNSGRFFSSKGEADNWAFAQLENDDSNWTKSGYRRFSTSQCKRNGQIGWTVNFRK